MRKNNLKWYEAPQVEVVEMETAGVLADSGTGSNSGGNSTDTDSGDDVNPFG